MTRLEFDKNPSFHTKRKPHCMKITMIWDVFDCLLVEPILDWFTGVIIDWGREDGAFADESLALWVTTHRTTLPLEGKHWNHEDMGNGWFFLKSNGMMLEMRKTELKKKTPWDESWKWWMKMMGIQSLNGDGESTHVIVLQVGRWRHNSKLKGTNMQVNKYCKLLRS